MFVDAVLYELRALLGTGEAPTWPMTQFGQVVPGVHSWQGQASDTAHASADDLNHRRLAIAECREAVNPILARAGELTAIARTQVDVIHQSWREDQAALAPIAASPLGQAALLQCAQLRIAEATQVVNRVRSEFSSLSAQVDTLVARLPLSRDDPARGPAVQLVDFRQGPPSDPNDPYYDDPPEPGGGYGSYHYGYEFSTREVWTAEQVMAEVQNSFSRYFTFTADQNRLVEGATVNLKGPLGEPEPVRVSSVTPTSFSFVSLPGHAEGAGRVIRFMVVPAPTSPVPGRLNWELRVAASGPISKGSVVPGASLVNKAVWGVFAENLQSRLPTLPPVTVRPTF